MSHFSAALGAIIRERDLRQKEFAAVTGVDAGQLSRYLKGETRPDIVGLERLCGPLEPAEIASMVVAYMRDDIPACAKDYVDVIRLSGRVREPEPLPEIFSRLPRETRDLLEFFARECDKSPEVVAALAATRALIG